MQTTQDLLDALRERAGSDRKAAALVGVSQPVFSEWRTGKKPLSDQRAVQIAELLRLDAAYVLAVVNGERAKSKETRATWRRVADAFGKAAALAAVALAPAIMPEARAFNNSPNDATTRAELHNDRPRRRRAVKAHFADTILQSLGLAGQRLTN